MDLKGHGLSRAARVNQYVGFSPEGRAVPDARFEYPILKVKDFA
jgi:hypothetical protein